MPRGTTTQFVSSKKGKHYKVSLRVCVLDIGAIIQCMRADEREHVLCAGCLIGDGRIMFFFFVLVIIKWIWRERIVRVCVCFLNLFSNSESRMVAIRTQKKDTCSEKRLHKLTQNI